MILIYTDQLKLMSTVGANSRSPLQYLRRSPLQYLRRLPLQYLRRSPLQYLSRSPLQYLRQVCVINNSTIIFREISHKVNTLALGISFLPFPISQCNTFKFSMYLT